MRRQFSETPINELIFLDKNSDILYFYFTERNILTGKSVLYMIFSHNDILYSAISNKNFSFDTSADDFELNEFFITEKEKNWILDQFQTTNGLNMRVFKYNKEWVDSNIKSFSQYELNIIKQFHINNKIKKLGL